MLVRNVNAFMWCIRVLCAPQKRKIATIWCGICSVHLLPSQRSGSRLCTWVVRIPLLDRGRRRRLADAGVEWVRVSSRGPGHSPYFTAPFVGEVLFAAMPSPGRRSGSPGFPHQPTLIRHHPNHLRKLPAHADVGVAQAAVEVQRVASAQGQALAVFKVHFDGA